MVIGKYISVMVIYLGNAFI